MSSSTAISGRPAATTDAAFSRNLDVLLAPLSKQLRYPLPTPSSLSLSAASGPVGDGKHHAARQEEGAEERGPEDSTDSSSAPCVIEELALKECEDRVDGLGAWKTHVQEGLVRAHECQAILQHVLDSVSSMRAVTSSVQEQSDSLSHNASVLMVRRAKLERVQSELQGAIQHFTHMEDLCREAEDPMLRATSARFPVLFQELEKEMEYLTRHAKFKSAKAYATKLAVAQQQARLRLKDAVMTSLKESQRHAAAAHHPSSSLPQRAASTTTTRLEVEVSPSASASAPSGALPLPAPPLADEDALVPQHDSRNNLSASSLHVSSDAGGGVDVVSRFTESLQRVNTRFLDKLDGNASLRRLVELRSSFSYSGAEAFGEEANQSIETDQNLQDILRCYRETRVSLVGPLLRRWLSAWCSLEVQANTNSKTDDSITLSSSLTSASRITAANSINDNNKDAVALVAATPDAVNNSLGGTLSGIVESTTLFSLPQLAEQVCILLDVSLQAEKTVLDAVWLREDFINALLPRLVADIAEELYHVFRSRLLRVDDIAELAKAVEHIQVVNLRSGHAAGVREISELWMRMIQDTQERIIFRTSVFLRQEVGRSRPTKELMDHYMTLAGCGVPQQEPHEEVVKGLTYVPGVVRAVQLLSLLYSTLEFSVFSVFAEEAINLSIQLSHEVRKSLRKACDSNNGGASMGAGKSEAVGLLVQLAHLLYLRQELSQIDANITVVEKSLDLLKIATKRKVEIVQSSRESKKDVESEVQASSTSLLRALCDVVARPLTGAAHKPQSEIAQCIQDMNEELLWCQRSIQVFLHAEPSMRTALENALQQRCAELHKELADSRAEGVSQQKPVPPPPAPQPDTTVPASLPTTPPIADTSIPHVVAPPPTHTTNADTNPQPAVAAPAVSSAVQDEII